MAEKLNPTLTARTRTNTIVGRRLDNGVIAFLGVPYAKPPVGALRWQTAQPLPESDAVLEAFSFGPIPMQCPRTMPDPKTGKIPEPLPMSEDCLYLNVWAADIEKKNKPVMVWLYGGSYVGGGASDERFYGGDLIAENPDVLLVTINYRVGLLGTLDLSRLDKNGTYRYSNNLAMLDTRAALRWIHENIAAFGGDNRNITLFGQSAGSNNITANLLTEESRKYFSKFIAQSSFALDIGLTDLKTARLVADTVIGKLGCESLEQLLAVPEEELLQVQDEVMQELESAVDCKLFSPVVDGVTLLGGEFEKLSRGAALGIKAMIGTNRGEYDQQFEGLDAEGARAMSIAHNRAKLSGRQDVVNAYAVTDPGRSEREAYMDLKNDLYQRVPANLLAEALSKHEDVYMYYLVFQDPDLPRRTAHGTEISIVFGHPSMRIASQTAYGIRQAWVNFARYGDPNHRSLPEWRKYDGKSRSTMLLGEPSRLADGVRLEDMALLYPLFGESRYLGNP